MTETINTIKRKHFSPEEDKLLINLTQIYGTKNWKTISKKIPGRSTHQCRERYSQFLSPELVNKPWTREEDEFLLQLYLQHGSKSLLFTQFLSGRSAISIKNRWNSHLKEELQHHHFQKTVLPPITSFFNEQPNENCASSMIYVELAA
jgi:hypothetical protein